MRHGQARTLLSEYALGLLVSDDLRDLEKHLLNCQACTLECDALTYAVGGLAAIGAIDPALLHIAMPVPPMPPGTLARIGDLVADALSLGPEALDPPSLIEQEVDLGWPAATVAAGAATQERWGFSSDDDLAARHLEQLASGEGEPFSGEQDQDNAHYAEALAASPPGLNGGAASNGGGTWPWGTAPAPPPPPPWDGLDQEDSEDVWAELARSSAAPNRGWQNQPAPVEEPAQSFAGDWSGTAEEAPSAESEAFAQQLPVDVPEPEELPAVHAEVEAPASEPSAAAAFETYTPPAATPIDDEEVPHDAWAALAATASDSIEAAPIEQTTPVSPIAISEPPPEATAQDGGAAPQLAPEDAGHGDVPADDWSLLAATTGDVPGPVEQSQTEQIEDQGAEPGGDDGPAAEIAAAVVLAPLAAAPAKRGLFGRFRRSEPAEDHPAALETDEWAALAELPGSAPLPASAEAAAAFPALTLEAVPEPMELPGQALTEPDLDVAGPTVPYVEPVIDSAAAEEPDILASPAFAIPIAAGATPVSADTGETPGAEEHGKEPEQTGEDADATVPTDDLAAATVEGTPAAAETAPEDQDQPLLAPLATAAVATPVSRRRFGWLRRGKEPESEAPDIVDDWAALAAPPVAILPLADAAPGEPDLPQSDDAPAVVAAAELPVADATEVTARDELGHPGIAAEPPVAQTQVVPEQPEPLVELPVTSMGVETSAPLGLEPGAPGAQVDVPSRVETPDTDEAVPSAHEAQAPTPVHPAEVAGAAAAGLAAKELADAVGDSREPPETGTDESDVRDAGIPAAAAHPARRFGWLRRSRRPEPETPEPAADDWADLASAEQAPAATTPAQLPEADAPVEDAAAAAIVAASIAAADEAASTRPRREPATPPEPPGEFDRELRELAGEEPPRPATPARLHREPRRRGPLARMLGGQDEEDFDDDPRALTSLDEEMRRVSRSATSVAGRPGFSPAYIPGPVEWGLESYADDDDEEDEESDEARVSSTWRYWALMFAAVSAVLFGIMVAGYFVLRDLNTESQGLGASTDGGSSGGLAVAVTFTALDTETELNLRGDGFVQPGADAILQFGGLPPIISGQRYVLWAESGDGVVTRLADRLPLGGSSTQYFSVPNVPADVKILFLTIEQQVDGDTPDQPLGQRLLEAEVP